MGGLDNVFVAVQQWVSPDGAKPPRWVGTVASHVGPYALFVSWLLAYILSSPRCHELPEGLRLFAHYSYLAIEIIWAASILVSIGLMTERTPKRSPRLLDQISGWATLFHLMVMFVFTVFGWTLKNPDIKLLSHGDDLRHDPMTILMYAIGFVLQWAVLYLTFVLDFCHKRPSPPSLLYMWFAKNIFDRVAWSLLALDELELFFRMSDTATAAMLFSILRPFDINFQVHYFWHLVKQWYEDDHNHHRPQASPHATVIEDSKANYIWAALAIAGSSFLLGTRWLERADLKENLSLWLPESLITISFWIMIVAAVVLFVINHRINKPSEYQFSSANYILHILWTLCYCAMMGLMCAQDIDDREISEGTTDDFAKMILALRYTAAMVAALTQTALLSQRKIYPMACYAFIAMNVCWSIINLLAEYSDVSFFIGRLPTDRSALNEPIPLLLLAFFWTTVEYRLSSVILFYQCSDNFSLYKPVDILHGSDEDASLEHSLNSGPKLYSRDDGYSASEDRPLVDRSAKHHDKQSHRGHEGHKELYTL